MSQFLGSLGGGTHKAFLFFNDDDGVSPLEWLPIGGLFVSRIVCLLEEVDNSFSGEILRPDACTVLHLNFCLMLECFSLVMNCIELAVEHPVGYF